MGSGASIGEELEEEEHSPKTQQLIKLAGRLAKERGIGDDQTVRFPIVCSISRVGAFYAGEARDWPVLCACGAPACRSWLMQRLEPFGRTI